MNTLTLTEIVPHLPYGLKGNYEVSDVVPNARHEIRGKDLTMDNIEFFLKYAKPILYPISHLTKPMEDGTVPLIECAKIAFPENNWKMDGVIAINEVGYHFFYINSFKCFVYAYGTREQSVPNQLALFQELAKMHIDFQDLIGQGKAIDATILNVNPYSL